MDGHPVDLLLTDDLRRSRPTVLFRLLLVLPHAAWLTLWTVLVALVWIPAWVIALVLGRLPGGLHRLFAAYVRYVTHVGAYLGLAANPYPGFSGTPGYDVDVALPDESASQPRWTILLRLPLGAPALALAAVLGAGISGGRPGADADTAARTLLGVAAVCAFLGWFASLTGGRMPLGLRNATAYGLGYAAQASAYVLFLTARYPDSHPGRLGPVWELPPHPFRLVVADDGGRSRLTVLFRLLLALPHLVWLGLWTIAAFFAGFANAIVALVRGSSAEPLHRFLGAYIRYTAHVTAYASLVANPFPGFTGAPGYPVDVEIEERAPQHRLVTLFRFFLSIPAILVATALGGVLGVVAALGWFASLVTGRMPSGLHDLGAYCVRYLTQANAYWFVVVDDYPNASPSVTSVTPTPAVAVATEPAA